MAIIQIQIQTLGSANLETNHPSLQIGDHAFYQTVDGSKPIPTANNPIYIGQITDLGKNYIKVDSTLNAADISGFLMYSKSKIANNSSLNGYYAEVEFRNNDSNHKAELFAINSEISQSSK
jgi:hypothetical protein